jgi:hypothetical protein
MGGQHLKPLRYQSPRKDQIGKEKRRKQLNIRVQQFLLPSLGKRAQTLKLVMRLIRSRLNLTIFLIFLIICSSAFLAGKSERYSPPNILVFLMDDMGIGDSRVYNKNSKVSMPNLEKLAAAGMTFSDAHSPAAVCAPSRYSVMTGNYPWRGRNPNGTWLFNMPSQILSGQQTVGQLMKKVGLSHRLSRERFIWEAKYTVNQRLNPKLSMNGGFKDFDFGRKVENTPASLGFDYAYELPQGIQGSPYIAIENGMLVGDAARLREWKTGTYGNSVIESDGFGSPDWDSSMAGPILTRKALSFLKRHSENNEESGIRKPFFMYYWSQSCHVPHTPPDELMGAKSKRCIARRSSGYVGGG